jgi:hypothetical protein
VRSLAVAGTANRAANATVLNNQRVSSWFNMRPLVS